MGKPNAIPEPPGWPILGNLLDIDMELPLQSLYNLADKHGEIYRMRFPGGHTFIIANSYAMVNEFCDERRFPKTISALREMRHAMHDGLFTAIDGQVEPKWGIAHRILVPAFGPSSLRNMLDGMYDIASQLAMKWARHGADSPITVTDDFTRLTLDTIALCSMDFRFNSYYKEGTHPFVAAMSDFLTESGDRARRLPIPAFFYRGKDKKFFQDIEVMRTTADEILQERKREKNLDSRKDLLSAMLNGVDPKTGQKMTEESILDNLITFLIAGHETTSGMLSFAMYHLLKHPEMYRRAQKEVEEICGKTPIRFEHLSKLSYISAVLRETLRLTPPLPVFNVAAKEDEIVGGKYPVRAGELIIVLVGRSQLDPMVFGADVHEFKPERMLDENFDRLNKEFPNAWKPFGNGTRGCIGRPFAWQEALLVLAMLLQNFDFEFDDPDYTLALKQTLTVKPTNFQIRATLRDGLTATTLEHRLAGTTPPPKSDAAGALNGVASTSTEGQPMSIYYGSNSGTCQSMAERLAADAFSHGFRARVVDCLDNAVDGLPADEPVIFITASYEGQPPDNAAHFVHWLEELKEEKATLQGISYAVFGCGHHDWAATFHRIPRLVDAALTRHGGERLAALGLTDVAAGNEMADFEAWEDEVLWPALTKRYRAAVPQGPALSVQVTSPRKATLHYDLHEASVVSTSTLTSPDAFVAKHQLILDLPDHMSYTAGDYLAILPVNPRKSVHRVLRHFHLPWDAHLTISTKARTPLPHDVSLPATHIFGSYVELAQPATKRDLLSLANAAKDPSTKTRLEALANDNHRYSTEIAAKRLSVLDVLESTPDIALPIASFLRMLPPMRLRQYSIGSSPLADPKRVVLTYSLHGEEGNEGAATSYLSHLSVGDKVHVAVRASHAAFHLPADITKTPVIMVAAGTGIAPFRGFIEERAVRHAEGQVLAPAVLYFGCRDPGHDDLHRGELDKWERQGVVTVWRAFSRRSAESEGCRYVQERVRTDRERVRELWEDGARVYVCGSRAVGEAVKEVLVDVFWEGQRTDEFGDRTTREEVRGWFDGLKNVRWAVDVFD
ncbi:bifunctional cytochrome P450/NADPH--P450 reductase [Aspergillus brunneoviolaceus CBS 621.78]|uniref:Cytochrome P450 n=1 Tax=Aspergillus brunneoviolaceus CBS 621.78 TaxID=1450534 RepID=A0ACD1FW91_9EURO|nr:cytochrome P450 [Aspergillus brunneoviolaceus CBS 621.78]RAH41205.1 cytochrome P450 [Aspergillus brunneoviolaceus CBS 621.78]